MKCWLALRRRRWDLDPFELFSALEIDAFAPRFDFGTSKRDRPATQPRRRGLVTASTGTDVTGTQRNRFSTLLTMVRSTAFAFFSSTRSCSRKGTRSGGCTPITDKDAG